MAKNKTNVIPHYELLYIVSNKYTEEELKPIMKTVEKIITDNKGKITHTEEWGKKKLSYPIKHFNHGYYILVEFDLDAESVKKVDQDLRMSNEILRHMIVVKIARSSDEIKKEKEKVDARAQKAIKEKQAEKEVKPAEVKPKPKVNLKDLDEKLDKILETDDLL